MDRDGIIKKFLNGLPARFEVAKGDVQLNAVLTVADTSAANGSRRARSIERLRYRLD
jgi:calcineurin-like phosphoesterase